MRRITIYLVLFGAAVAALATTIVWYLGSFQVGRASVGGMMGQMMGNPFSYGMTSPMPSYVWAIITLLIVLAAIGIVGIVYYLAMPEIATAAAGAEAPEQARRETSRPHEDWSTILRTSKPEEKQVLGVLASHNGTYLQKFIVKESGLSKLKTHRIISRFADRGIVTISKSGNTNEVTLAPWLKPDAGNGKGPETKLDRS